LNPTFKNASTRKRRRKNNGVKIHYVGRKQQYRSLEDNLASALSAYPLTDGFFGEKGKSRGVREIRSRNHEATAKDFFNRIAKGGILDLRTAQGAVLTRMKDGSVVSYRKITSSVNSPAVEIRFRKADSKCEIKDQKIHFVQCK
jgi:hypothetical protein